MHRSISIKTISWRFREAPAKFLGCPTVTSQIQSPTDVFNAFKALFCNQVRERFIVIWLSSSNHVMGYEVITEGLLNSSLVHPREVFRGAIVATCASVILMHNHPSNNLEPSREDISITKQIVEAGKIIGIPVHDHIIFTNDTYTSLTERGLM
jgi:DNA repair protein RadC